MDDMEGKLNAILSDPSAMEKIMGLAQTLNLNQQPSPPSNETVQVSAENSIPGNIDLSMLQKLGGLISQSGADQNERTLLHALHPYLNQERIHKLERALRASKIARMATSVLGSNVLSSLMGGGGIV